MSNMSDLLDKLNVLLRSSLNNFLSGERERPSQEKRRITPEKLGKDVDREIASLRKQLEVAMAEEDAMKARVEELRRQIADLDRQADEALQRGNDAQARYIVQQMRRQEQRVTILESEIEQHKQATFELMQNVNTLEALVSDARRQQGIEPEAERASGGLLSDVIRGVRETVEGAVRVREAAPQSESPPASDASPAKRDPDVEDDLAKRRARLSGPG